MEGHPDGPHSLRGVVIDIRVVGVGSWKSWNVSGAHSGLPYWREN